MLYFHYRAGYGGAFCAPCAENLKNLPKSAVLKIDFERQTGPEVVVSHNFTLYCYVKKKKLHFWL